MRNKKPLGCLTWSAILATLVTVVSLTGVVLAAGQDLFSPGSLNAQAGAPLGDVSAHAEIDDCSQCHAAPWDADTMQERCARCHADIQLEVSDPQKLHGKLSARQGVLACGACHPEHRGAQALLTDVPLDEFPHELLGFATTSHAQLPEGAPFTCQACHVSGYKVFETADCADCHLRLERPFMVLHLSQYAADCRACHDGQESIQREFQHTQTILSPIGVHTQLACVKCHTGAHQLADFKASPARCVDCHLKDNPHSETLGVACESCHNQQHWKEVLFEHAATGFALDGRHSIVACEGCHTTPGQFRQAPTTCVGCHQKDDVHNGSEGQACEDCHTSLDWKTSTFEHNTVFELAGGHAAVACEQCHTTPSLFTGAPTTCVGCHQPDDPHKGSQGTDCAQCHTINAWKPSTFNHDRSIFKLTGAHQVVACSNCHTIPNMFTQTPTDCVACHQQQDAHQGSLGADCSRCHSTTAWNPSFFDHNTAAFRLTGLHASAGCTQCHFKGVFKGTPMSCYACHQKDDRHAGSEGTACGNCHTSWGWRPSTFNHNNAAFALTGAHVSTLCSKCHTVLGIFKGTPQDCYACHVSDDHHGGTLGTNCGTCHATSAWAPSIFDHNLTTFPLTGQHQNQVCSACHPGDVFSGTPTDCASCHSEPALHAGIFGTSCAACHSTSNWDATYAGPHSFPMQHGSSNGSCATCHPSTLTQWTCHNCHDQGQMALQHAEDGIFEISSCVQCHPAGRKD